MAPLAIRIGLIFITLIRHIANQNWDWETIPFIVAALQ